jgi:hypothetical protein
MYTGVPSTQVDQIDEIRGRKFGESNQIGLNLNEMGPRFSSFTKVWVIGRWYEMP